jgi:hypothetical protein
MEPRTVPLLDAEECARIREGLTKLRRYWTPRHPEIPSFTLGAAAYLDIPDHGHARYLSTTTRTRRVMLRDFGWLYERLVAKITEETGTPARLTQIHAPPGFHIFQMHERLIELVPKLHFDLQHEDLDWVDDPNDDPKRRITFTVPIEVPRAGAGVYVWPIRREDTLGKTKAELEKLHADTPPTFHEYHEGSLLLHDGNRLHQIAADRPMEDHESRVTFQGHGVLSEGDWQLYW